MNIKKILLVVNVFVFVYIALTSMVLRGKSGAVLAGIRYELTMIHGGSANQASKDFTALAQGVDLAVSLIPGAFDILFKTAMCSIVINVVILFLWKRVR